MPQSSAILRGVSGGPMKLAFIFLAVTFLGFATGSCAQTPAPGLENQADAIFSAVTQEPGPGLAILVTVVGFHLLGEGLRRKLDPKA